jgi:hypothetical protein
MWVHQRTHAETSNPDRKTTATSGTHGKRRRAVHCGIFDFGGDFGTIFPPFSVRWFLGGTDRRVVGGLRHLTCS